MFGWLNASGAKDFGESLADFFVEKMPLEAGLNESKRASKTQYTLDKMGVRVTDYQRTNSLNAYQKAKLANAFKWKLKDAGYEAEYVETLVAWLVTRMEAVKP